MPATVKFTGDFAKLQRLIGRFEAISTPGFRKELNKQLAQASLELAQDGFTRSISPYGVRWKDPKYRVGKPLLDTRRLSSSLRPFSTVADFGVVTNVVYAAPHQYGWPAKNIPQRQYLPIVAMGFGGRWRRELFDITHKHVMRGLGRAI